jgi:hypothetical protein
MNFLKPLAVPEALVQQVVNDLLNHLDNSKILPYLCGMKIIHKISRDEITDFPHYCKFYSVYGYLVVTFDHKILHFNESGIDDLTDEFEIYEK